MADRRAHRTRTVSQVGLQSSISRYDPFGAARPGSTVPSGIRYAGQTELTARLSNGPSSGVNARGTRMTRTQVDGLSRLIVALIGDIHGNTVTIDATRIRPRAAARTKADSLRFTPRHPAGAVRQLSASSHDTVATDAAVATATATAIHDSRAAMTATGNRAQPGTGRKPTRCAPYALTARTRTPAQLLGGALPLITCRSA